jgi:hypothetical protein
MSKGITCGDPNAKSLVPKKIPVCAMRKPDFLFPATSEQARVAGNKKSLPTVVGRDFLVTPQGFEPRTS